jgi:PAS domain S-box-containing protein
MKAVGRPFVQLPESENHPAVTEIPEPLQDVYDSTPVSLFSLDRLGRIRELNAAGAKFLGFSPERLIGKAFVVFVARKDVQSFLNLLLRARQDPDILTTELEMSVSKKTVPVQISMWSAQKPDLTHRVTLVDLTDFRTTEKLLQESLSNWYSLVQNAPDTILTVDALGGITFVNKPLWGYSTSALVGTNILDYIPESERRRVMRCLERSFRHNTQMGCEVTGIGGNYNKWFSISFGLRHPSFSVTRGLHTSTMTLMIHEISAHKQAEETLRNSGEQLRDVAARVEAAREEERARVAREIHDELGQALTALKLDLSWVRSKTRMSKMRQRMESMIGQVDETIERVRRIASELRPAVLDDLGLVAAIEWQVAQFRKRTNIRTRIVSNTDGLSLPPEASSTVFRVVQEALTNIIRHAKATTVRVTLDYKPYVLEISIVDNGIGFKRSAQRDLKSLGIVGMKERVTRLGGQFNIFSEPGKGTRLDILIPTANDQSMRSR